MDVRFRFAYPNQFRQTLSLALAKQRKILSCGWKIGLHKRSALQHPAAIQMFACRLFPKGILPSLRTIESETNHSCLDLQNGSSGNIHLLRRGTMNRRGFLTSIAALPGAALLPEALAQSDQHITHVDAKTNGALLQSRVVKAEGIRPEGAAPGAKAYVNFNGPTKQLAALASGFVTLAPGAQPHPPHRHPEEEIMIVGEGAGEFR